MRRNAHALAGFDPLLMSAPSLAFALLLACAAGNQAAAQADRTAPDALRNQVERRFTVLPVRDGLALRPKAPARSEQTIEVSGGDIAVDGAPVTGSELRSRLGADADLVLQLSYLDVAAQHRLFSDTPAPASPVPPSPPAESAASGGPPDSSIDRESAAASKPGGIMESVEAPPPPSEVEPEVPLPEVAPQARMTRGYARSHHDRAIRE